MGSEAEGGREGRGGERGGEREKEGGREGERYIMRERELPKLSSGGIGGRDSLFTRIFT